MNEPVDMRLAQIVETTMTGNAVQKAKAYNDDVNYLLLKISHLNLKLGELKADPEKLSKLEVAAKIDPDHLQRLLALEKAVVSAGYCGMPTG